MPLTQNKKAFQAATAAGLPALIRVYSGLVLLELALKEHLSIPNLGHDVPEMLRRLAQQKKPQAAALNQQRSDLTNKLSALFTTRIDDSIGRVRPDKYPDLRYLRHIEDFSANASSEKELQDLRVSVDRLRSFLKTNVGLKQPI
jgi:hypothetical protein